MIQTIHLDGLDFEVRRSYRRKTLGITVDRAGELVAHAPAETPSDEVSRWISKKLLWVHRKLALKKNTAPRVRGPEYVSGEAFSYLGRNYRLTLVRQQAEPLRFDGTQFILRHNAHPAELHFQRWYIKTGSEWLRGRAKHLSGRIGSEPICIKVRDLGFRWGSCSRSGVVYLNWRVLQLPVRLADYVIAHELVHLRERHHRAEFWNTLSRAMPDWPARKEALAKRAKEYLTCGLGTRRSCCGVFPEIVPPRPISKEATKTVLTQPERRDAGELRKLKLAGS